MTTGVVSLKVVRARQRRPQAFPSRPRPSPGNRRELRRPERAPLPLSSLEAWSIIFWMDCFWLRTFKGPVNAVLYVDDRLDAQHWSRRRR